MHSAGPVVAIGVFDGVHLGHRALLAAARDVAVRADVPLVALTFDPHPMRVVRPDVAPDMLATLQFRRQLLHGVGVDAVEVITFDRAVSQWDPHEFARRYLQERLAASHVVVGENFRFGHRAAGDVATLTDLGLRFGFTVDPVQMVTGDGDRVWSSSHIRALVAAGEVSQAAVGLARPHRVEGLVVRGDRRGRELGYPTANVAIAPHLCRPGDGVYAGWLITDPNGAAPTRYPAAISVGANATFDGAEVRVEAHVIEPGNHSFYDEEVAVDFVTRLRSMESFDSVADLLAAMATDVSRARGLLS